jgi:hypothetical protein
MTHAFFGAGGFIALAFHPGKGPPGGPTSSIFYYLGFCLLYSGSDFRGGLGIPWLVKPLSLGETDT